MFPTLPIRLLAAAAIFVGAWVWVSAVPALAAGDGSRGLSLMMAQGGPAAALMKVLLCAIPAILLSLLCSSVGNPLCGLFTLTTALWVVAASGEPINAWIHRTDAKLPGDYNTLAAEVAVWTLMVAVFMFIVHFARPHVRKALPVLTRDPHLGEELSMLRGWAPALVSGAVAAVVGGVLAYYLLRSPAKGQVIGSLMLAFMVGGLLGDLASTFLFQKHPANPIGYILAPMAVALVAYLMTAKGYREAGDFLKAYYEAAGAAPPPVEGPVSAVTISRLSGLALALPIDFASAGIAGCALGAGWSQVMLHGEQPRPAAPAQQAAT